MSTRKTQRGTGEGAPVRSEGPDVREVMREIEAAAQRISRTEGVEAVARSAPRMPPPVPELEESWDVWRIGPVQSHRGFLGLPIVLAKRALLLALKLHDRELLKRQRSFNRAVLAELEQLRTYVSELAERSGDAEAGRGSSRGTVSSVGAEAGADGAAKPEDAPPSREEPAGSARGGRARGGRGSRGRNPGAGE